MAPPLPVRRVVLALAAAAAALLPATAPAAADVVTTAEGLVLEGKASRRPDGGWRLETPDGEVSLAAAQVVQVVPGEGPRSRILAKAGAVRADDAAGQYRLALEAQAAGLADVAAGAFEKVIAVEPDHPAARRAMGQERVDDAWVSVAEARRRRGLVLFGGRWLLPSEVPVAGTAPPRSAGADDAKVRGWIRASASDQPALSRAALSALGGVDADRQLAAGLAVLFDRDPAARRAAARHLARLGDESALRALILSGARDVDPSVRREAVLAAQSFGNDDTAIPFVRALGSSNPRTMANAAEALALLGDVRAAPYVVKRLVSHGASSRNFVAFTRQISYVRDYDVEIAQASNIANPDVSTLQEGVILDARVNDAWLERTWIEGALVGSLSQLVGQELRSREDALAWWEQNKGTIPSFPDAPTKRKS